MKRLQEILVGVVLSVAFVSFSGAQAFSAETLRIGVSASLSGPAVAWGQGCSRTIETQAKLYNEAGGVKIGDKVYKIELVMADDKYLAESGAAAINKLIFRDKVDYILLGGPSTLVALSGGPICQKNEVLFICDGASGPGLGPELTWVFRGNNTEYERVWGIMAWLTQNRPEIHRIAYCAPDTEGGHAASKMFVEAATKYAKWQFVAGEFFEPASKDYYPVLNKILKEKPDIIYTDTASTGDCGLLIKQSRELGFDKIIWSGVMQDVNSLVNIAGEKACENVFLPNMTYDATPEIARISEAFKKNYGSYDSMIFFTCDFLPILIQGMQSAGTIDKHKVRNALETAVFTSPRGPGARFYGKERYGIAHQWLSPIGVVRIHEGKNYLEKIVSPEETLKAMGLLK